MSGNRHPRRPVILPVIPAAVLAVCLSWGLPGGGEALADGLVDHRATYAMKMVRSSGQGGMSGARGAMVYEFRDTCDGWQVDTKVYLRLRSGRGPEMETVRLVSSWEAKDGSGFRFRVTEKTGGEVSEEIRGVAVTGEDGGIAEYTRPKSFTVKLPRDTVFPTAHLRSLIKTGSDGGKHLSRVVFDGGTLENPYVVGAQVRPRGAAPNAWRARMAYFPFNSRAQTPEFELGVDYGDDGVVQSVLQDFGDYQIEARITRLEKLDAPIC